MKQMYGWMVWMGALVLTVSGGQAAESKAKSPAPSPAAGTNLFADTVVAKGKTFTIKQSEVEELYTKYKASLAAQGRTLPEGERASIQYSILKDMVDRRVVSDRATAADKSKAKTKSDEMFADYKKRAPSEEIFNRQLVANGMTLAEFQKGLLEQATLNTVVEREVRSKITIKDAVAKKFYEDNAERFDEPERVRASHILIGTKDPASGQDLNEDKKKEKKTLADKVLARAKAGEDFAKLAKEFSDDPGSKDRGGEYTFGRNEMVPEFEKAAFGLEINKISDLVSTEYGYHIIKLSEKLPARKTPFSEVSAKIIERLAGEETNKQLPDYLAKVRLEAGAQVLIAAPPAPKE
jgi:peptidyl-prolyl cis-trans isomerase C